MKRRDEPSASQEFDALLDELMEDFEAAVERHRQKLQALREAMNGGQ